MRVDYAYTVEPGDDVMIDTETRIYVATVSMATHSRVAAGRDEVVIETTDGRRLLLWADQVITVMAKGEKR